MKKRISDLRAHPENEHIYHRVNTVADTELKESILREGLLEPIAITKDGLVLSGHRRLRACIELGFKEVECRVVRTTNPIVTLISYNKHRTKTPSEILAEASYLSRELQRAVGRGRGAAKKRAGKSVRTDDLTAEKIGVSKGNLRWLKYIQNRRPDLIPRIGKDLSLEEAKRLCKPKSSSDDPFQKDILSVLSRHKPSYQDLQLAIRQYPPFIYESTGVSPDEVTELEAHLNALSRLDARQILLVRKYDEIRNADWINDRRVVDLKKLLPTATEIVDWIQGLNGLDEVEIHRVSGKTKGAFSPSDYRILRTLLSSATFDHGPGNESKFVVGFTKHRKFRLLGLVRLHSDFAQLQDRETHIGWDREVRAERREYISNLMDCVPVETFGTNALGGKFLTLLATHPRVISGYARPVVGLTITSLFGIKQSMYHGLEKWGVRSIGQTNGSQLIAPLTTMKNKWSMWLSNHFPLEKQGVLVGTNRSPVTSPKQHELGLIYKLLGFSRTRYLESYNRGLFFVERHEDGRVWLRGRKKELPPVKDMFEEGLWFEWWLERAKRQISKKSNSKELVREVVSQDEISPEDVKRRLLTSGLPRQIVEQLVR